MARNKVEHIREQVEKLQQDGVTTIEVGQMLTFVRGLEAEAEPVPVEVQYSADRDLHRAAQEHQWKWEQENSTEMFRSVIAAGQSAIRSLILINGGAAVAMLAYIGHLATMNSADVPTFARCLLPFTLGVLLAGLVSAGTYLSQFLMASPPGHARTAGIIINWIVIALGAGALVAFGWGMWSTYQAFLEPRIWRNF